MPHIDLPEGLPGILGPMAYRPETAEPLNLLAEVLLRGESTLTRGERELIATYVSDGNDCFFCATSHGTFAKLQLENGEHVVKSVRTDYRDAPISPKLKSLLAIAGKVRIGGKSVTGDDVEDARNAGATDIEIHDTVLIAAAFCMYNRYVDGLATWAPTEQEAYDGVGQMIVTNGYVGSVPKL
jgi:uncharacterized peroxidase-related enzyme